MNTHITIGGHKVSAGKVYSTSEVKTGDVWIDGKPIYRKVIDFGSGPNNTAKYVSTGIINLDKVINAYGFGTTSTDLWPIPYVFNSASNNIGMFIRKSDTPATVCLFTDGNRSSAYIYIVIEYTKTTD